MSTMNTGDVSRRIGLTITATLLEELGFKPAGQDKRAVLWDQADYPEMCKKIGKWVAGRADVEMQPKPEPRPGKPKADKPAKDTMTTKKAVPPVIVYPDDDEI